MPPIHTLPFNTYFGLFTRCYTGTIIIQDLTQVTVMVYTDSINKNLITHALLQLSLIHIFLIIGNLDYFLQHTKTLTRDPDTVTTFPAAIRCPGINILCPPLGTVNYARTPCLVTLAQAAIDLHRLNQGFTNHTHVRN